MIIVGLDSAERTGFAVLDIERGRAERLIDHGLITAHSGADVAAAVERLAQLRPSLVGIEAPYVRAGFTGRGGNAVTGLALATLLGRWLQEWKRRTVSTTTVLASSWQPFILIGLIDRRSDRAVRKAAARAWAQRTFGVDLSEDEADAACIGTWAARRGFLGRRAA